MVSERLACIFEVLLKINMVSKTLKKVIFNVQSKINLINSIQSFLDNMRSVNRMNNIITGGKDLAEKIRKLLILS